MRTKLAGLVTIIAAVGTLALGIVVAEAAPAVPTHHIALATAATPGGTSSGEGPNGAGPQS
jgi:hypothetical protein